MKITLLTQYYKPEMGAAQNRLFEMCLGLKSLGADVSIINEKLSNNSSSISSAKAM